MKKLPLFAVLALFSFHAFAQGTAFMYQGRLNDGASPANGTYDLTFTLFGASSGGVAVAGPATNSATSVVNGLFIATLDFGTNFPGADRWLEIGARTNGGGAFTTLAPRQKLAATPYAITSSSVVSGGLAAGTYGNAVTFSNAANSFTGSGSGLTALNAAQLTSGQVPVATLSNAWKTTGNAGTTGAKFLGTTDNQPLEIKVNSSRALRLEPNTNGAPNVIAGSPRNFVSAGVVGATIAGGGAIDYSGIPYTNSVSEDFGTIGGGAGNTIQGGADRSTIGGGYRNSIQAGAYYSTIGGGLQNTIDIAASHSTIGGGDENSIQISTEYSTIGGGSFNTIQTRAVHSTIGGGRINTIQPDVDFSTIGGGLQNTNSGSYATVPGGDRNVAGTNSFAAGHRAKATHIGSFVWADSTDTDFATTADQQFLIRAAGGVGIGTTSPESELHIFRGSAGSVTANATSLLSLENSNNAFMHILTPATNVAGVLFGNPGASLDASVRYNNSGSDRELSFRTLNSQRMVILTNGSVGIGISIPTNTLHVNGGVSATAFVTTSDRNAKENLMPVSPQEVLSKVIALPITTWNFKTMNDGRHMGPMAQDFFAAFGLGGGDTTITSVDPDGVALAAIQGLNQKLEEQRIYSKTRDAEIESLKQIVAELKRQIESQAAKK